MSKKNIIETYTSQATQQFVMMLMHIEQQLEVDLPKIDVELETEDDKWKVTVEKIK